MIEAVNSVLASAPLIRSAVVQDKQAQNVAGAVEGVKDSPQAPYVSPYVSYDVNLNAAVIQFRDSDTGDVVEQLPSRLSIEAQRRNEVTDEADRGQSAGGNGLLQAQEAAASNSDTVAATSSSLSPSVAYGSSDTANASKAVSEETSSLKITVEA